jgi:general secretion pathway protein G
MIRGWRRRKIPTTFLPRGVFILESLPRRSLIPPPMKTHKTIRPLQPTAGFTLLEMVIVLGIIAVLLGGSIALIGGLGESAKLQRVESDFNTISAALNGYQLNAGTYPTTQQGLRALVERPSSSPQPRRWTKVADSVPKDPWGNEYIYRFPGSKDPSKFEIVSMGKDGIAGTNEDLSSQDPK